MTFLYFSKRMNSPYESLFLPSGSSDNPTPTTLEARVPQMEERTEPNGVHLTVFPFYMWLRNQNWTFKNTNEDRPFLKPRKPFPPKGSA